MKSALPKVLHPMAGAPMVFYAVENALRARDAAGSSGTTNDVVLVVGHGREQVESAVRARFGDQVRFAVQTEQRGTADAVRAGLAVVPAHVTEVLITYGDAPRVPSEALTALIDARARLGSKLALVTAEVADATGYGRILHDGAGRVVGIREHRDCSEGERAIRWFNPGLYAIDRAFLEQSLPTLEPRNAQGELYLTDLVELASRDAAGVAEVTWSAEPLHGVNDRAELFAMERAVYEARANAHRRDGVTIARDVSIGPDVVLERDVVLGPGVTLQGRTRVAEGARIDAGCVLEDATVGAGTHVKPYCVLTQCTVRANAAIGPFAHLRPASDVGDGAHVGNFVELKNTVMHPGAKANHLAYLGDGDVGAKANIGAGTIFCNYDGFAKHRTVIEPGAFVGSNSSIVAPVTIGADAYVASGSVVTRDVPADALALARARQENKEGYAAKIRAMKKSAKKA